MSLAQTRLCEWCQAKPVADPRAHYCGQTCRQAAWRLRRRRTTVAEQSHPMRMAYADPPYPGLSAKYYRHEPTYAGEVDHAALIASLRSSYDGWALSTSSEALRDVLPLCPPGAHVCPWTKPNPPNPRTRGPHNLWEPLIVVPGRRLQPGVSDVLRAKPARFGGTLMGRKPIAFCAWLFDLLGLLPGDTLDDLFPGTGIVGRAWASQAALGDTSSNPGGDASLRTRVLDDMSQAALGDASSAKYLRDMSPSSPGDASLSARALDDKCGGVSCGLA